MTVAWEAAERAFGPAAGRPPFWAVPWVGGQALARYLLDHADAVAGRRVLDFGAGSGLCAIAAAMAGAARVAAAETDPIARVACSLNASLNRASIDIVDEDLFGRDLAGYDVVLAGDLWYERTLAEKVTPWLRRLAGGGLNVLIGDRRRAYFPKGGIEPLAVYDVATSTDVEPATMTSAGVWRVRAERS
jgi:predicted nicotinamide N-methyase